MLKRVALRRLQNEFRMAVQCVARRISPLTRGCRSGPKLRRQFEILFALLNERCEGQAGPTAKSCDGAARV